MHPLQLSTFTSQLNVFGINRFVGPDTSGVLGRISALSGNAIVVTVPLVMRIGIGYPCAGFSLSFNAEQRSHCVYQAIAARCIGCFLFSFTSSFLVRILRCAAPLLMYFPLGINKGAEPQLKGVET